MSEPIRPAATVILWRDTPQGARGLIHYVQSFCHRQIEDRLWRERMQLPILTLEADRPGKVDERTRTRIEAFMERLDMGGA